MSDGRTGRGSDQFPLRLPDGMRDRIKAAAEASNRSMNAEIVARLEKTFDPRFAALPTEGELSDMLGEVFERLDRLEGKGK